MNWAEKHLLNLLWIVPFLWLFLVGASRSSKKALYRLVSPRIVERLVSGFSVLRRRIQTTLFLLATVLLCLAAARPQWGTRMETITRRGVDVVIAIDTSLSMEVPDVIPNRLEKAKHMMRELIDRLDGNRIGVIAFSGTAFVQCPLTLDHAAAKIFLDIINTRSIPLPGTHIGEALRTGIGVFNEKEKQYKVLVLLTDGEDHEKGVVAATEEAQQAGIIIYCIGVGTSSGQPIPLRDEKGGVLGYKKDSRGEVVVSRLDEKTLEEIATTTGGKYYFATPGEAELDDLYENISKMDQRELESKIVRSYEERFQYFVAVALFLLMAEMLLGGSWKRKPMQNQGQF